MLRRSYLGFASDRGLGAADTVSRVMQRELKWSEERRRDELTRYESRVREDLLEGAPSSSISDDVEERHSSAAGAVGARRRI